jgi:hypothetical protein
MKEPDMGAQIMKERLAWAVEMVEEQFADKTMTDYEKMFLAVEIAKCLYVRKEMRAQNQ